MGVLFQFNVAKRRIQLCGRDLRKRSLLSNNPSGDFIATPSCTSPRLVMAVHHATCFSAQLQRTKLHSKTPKLM